MDDAECDCIPASAGGGPPIKLGALGADEAWVESRRGADAILDEDDMTPLIPFPPNEVPIYEAVPALVTEVSVESTSQTEIVDSSYLSEGIDYESISIPSPAPAGTFVDPLEGPEPFDD